MNPHHIFTWVQLSDVHVGHGDPAWAQHQRLALPALLDDLRRRTADPPINAIFVTGDIAFSGGALHLHEDAPPEYEAAAAWLSEVADVLSVRREDIILVPGNHDIVRATHRSNRGLLRMLESLRTGHEQLDDCLASQEDRELLGGRLQNFFEFTRSLRKNDDCSKPWWTIVRGTGDSPVRIVGLNTTLLANDDLDRGKLRLGMRQVQETLAQDDSAIIVLLTHHPLSDGWLADQKDISPWIARRVDIHLYGHVHEADSSYAASGTGKSLVSVSAGAVHPENSPGLPPSSHGYNIASIVSLERGELVLRIWPRRWSKKRAEFVVDVDNLPEGASYVDHPLGRVRRAKSTSGSTSAVNDLPQPMDHLSLSVSALAERAESVADAPIELLAIVADRAFVWIRSAYWSPDTGRPMLIRLARLLCGNPTITEVEVGLCNTAQLPHTCATDRIAGYRFIFDATELRRLSRLSDADLAFWRRAVVEVQAEENVLWAPFARTSAADVEGGSV